MSFRRTVLLPIVVYFGAAVGQTDYNYNGTWSIHFDGKKTVDLEGSVVINGSEGTWKVIARSAKNPCVGRDYPLAVKNANSTELVVEVGRAQVLTGCKNSTYTFNRVDAKTLKGELGDGRAVTLNLE